MCCLSGGGILIEIWDVTEIDVMNIGAAGVMIAPPNTLRTDDHIVNYDRQASDEIGGNVPWVSQDELLTFNVVMSSGVVKRTLNEMPSCMMLKHENWSGLEKISALRTFERDGSERHISILRAERSARE